MASIIIKVSRKIIGRIFSQNKKKTMRMTERREKTLKKLIENALVYTVYTLAILTLLETIGIKIGPLLAGAGIADRKSTRLNSSHVSISYAVFCLKKKKKFIDIYHSHL